MVYYHGQLATRWGASTDRNEETTGPVFPFEEGVAFGVGREEFEPGVVAVEDEFAVFGCADLGQPGILGGEGGRGIGFGKIED